MKIKIWLLMFALLLPFLVSSKQIFALAETTSVAQDSDTSPTQETAVHMTERINDYRTEQGLPAYYHDQSLEQASQWLVDTMAATEFISHYDENGKNPQQRAEKAGYNEHVTEIIFGGFGGAEAAWEWWMENELHSTLLISEDYVEFGVATAVSEQSGRQYWAIMFGFGDGHYETDGVANLHGGGVNAVTKLPSATSTSEVTAVPPTSTATQPDPTATASQIALVANETDAPTAIDNNPNITNGTDTNGLDSLEETKWLIVAAFATIIIGAAIFYFPRLGLSQKFKERT